MLFLLWQCLWRSSQQKKCQDEDSSRSPIKEKGVCLHHHVEPPRNATCALTFMNIHETATAGLNSKISSSSFFEQLRIKPPHEEVGRNLLLLLSQLKRILTLSIKQTKVKDSADFCRYSSSLSTLGLKGCNHTFNSLGASQNNTITRC